MKVLEKTNEIILSREEYDALIEQIEDLEDIIDAYNIKQNDQFIPFDESKY